MPRTPPFRIDTDGDHALPLLVLIAAGQQDVPRSGTLVFRSFLALSPAREARGHAGDGWFTDLVV
jgi:hypothetical protein